MRILAIEQPGAREGRQALSEDAVAEAWRVWSLYQEGIIREIFFRADRPEAVILLECRDLLEAQEALASLPLVASAAIRFEVLPLRPYPGLARLFARR